MCDGFNLLAEFNYCFDTLPTQSYNNIDLTTCLYLNNINGCSSQLSGSTCKSCFWGKYINPTKTECTRICLSSGLFDDDIFCECGNDYILRIDPSPNLPTKGICTTTCPMN